MVTLKMRSARRIATCALVAVLGGCRGPDPTIERQTLERFSATGTAPFRIEAVVRNSGGSGEVEVEARLIRRSDGETISSGSKDVALLEKHGQIVVLELPRPPSTASGLGIDELDLRVEAHYPIE